MRLLFAALLVLLLPAFAGAQVPLPAPSSIGKQIVEIHLTSEGRPADEPMLLDLVETRVGEPLAMADVRESISHLFSLGRFQDVQVEATDVPGGISLLYNLVPVHSVSRLDFHGDLGVSERLVRNLVEDRFGKTPPLGRAADVANVLEQEFYPDHGYMNAQVKWVPTVVHDPDRTLLTFDIDAGPRAVIRDIDIVGTLLDGRASFDRQVGAEKGEPFEAARIRRRLSEYVDKLRKRGRYEATATFVPNVSDEGTAVDLRFNVQPGPAVTVVFRGDPLPPDKIKELVPVEREGSIDEDLLEDSARRITDFLHEQGYWKATAASAREESGDAVTIVFTVRKGLQYHVVPAGVEVTGNRQVPIELIRPMLARLQPDDLYLSSNLGAAVAGIANLYRTRGFASVSVKAAENEKNPTAAGLGQIQPAITIVEGPLTFVGDVTFEGNQYLPDAELRATANLSTGSLYYEPAVEQAREAVLLSYLNAGFPNAAVVVKSEVMAEGSRANLQFHITEGQQTIVDHIIIVGNTRTDPRIIQRELRLQPGKPLGLEDRLESRRRLGALGLFRRISIEELPHTGEGRRDILVTVEEAAATTLSYGGGMEVTRRLRATGPNGEAEEHLEFAPRGFFDVGRRNIAGKNRSVNLYTRLSLRPRDAPDNPAKDGTGFGFSEYRVVGTYREPRALGMSSADLTLTAAVEQGVRSSFNFARKGINADLMRRLSARVRASARYSFGTTRTFDERLDEAELAQIDRVFPRGLRLSSFAGAVSFDTRDDVIEPSRGGFLSAEVTIAARALGGQVGFMKSYMQGFWFRSLPGTRRVVLATRAAVGLADGFPREVPALEPGGAPAILEDLPASERFFAGGDSTIRGYALDTVGAPNTISPTTGFPIGGNAVLITNAELRVPVWGDFGAAFFVDGGNVFNRVTEFDFGELRGSYGVGIRYRSPIGPIRLDLGFKMDRREFGGKRESPRAFHFSIGQAF